MNLINPSLRAAQIFLAATLLFVSLSAPAQSPQPSSSASAKGGKEVACDGALEIVPTKQVSFVRKRRPANGKPVRTKGAAEKNSGGTDR